MPYYSLLYSVFLLFFLPTALVAQVLPPQSGWLQKPTGEFPPGGSGNAIGPVRPDGKVVVTNLILSDGMTAFPGNMSAVLGKSNIDAAHNWTISSFTADGQFTLEQYTPIALMSAGGANIHLSYQPWQSPSQEEFRLLQVVHTNSLESAQGVGARAYTDPVDGSYWFLDGTELPFYPFAPNGSMRFEDAARTVAKPYQIFWHGYVFAAKGGTSQTGNNLQYSSSNVLWGFTLDLVGAQGNGDIGLGMTIESQLTVTAVPELSSKVFLIMASVGFGLWRIVRTAAMSRCLIRSNKEVVK